MFDALKKLTDPYAWMAFAAILLVVVSVFAGGVWKLSSMLDEAEARGASAEKTRWELSIAEANLRVKQIEIRMAEAATAAESRLNAVQLEHSAALAELEKKNAALPGAGDVALSADRVRALSAATRRSGTPRR